MRYLYTLLLISTCFIGTAQQLTVSWEQHIRILNDCGSTFINNNRSAETQLEKNYWLSQENRLSAFLTSNLEKYQGVAYTVNDRSEFHQKLKRHFSFLDAHFFSIVRLHENHYRAELYRKKAERSVKNEQ